MFEFEISSKDTKTKARTGKFLTPHGTIKTPVFMPVGTLAAVKTLSPDELTEIGAEIILANTYHLYLRPGHELIKKMGGLHKWMAWNGPILTDSGGFQVFSLGAGQKKTNYSNRVKIFEDGVEFSSHLDGSKHFFTPEKVMEIEHALGADIIMAFDECAPHDSSYEYAKKAMERTHNWVIKCKEKHFQLQSESEVKQALFPIIQGTVYEDLRKESAQFCANLDLHGIAIGGLSVGESRETMHHILEILYPHLPENKPRYLMGVGTPSDLFECIERGIDMFDCVDVTRLSRHSCFYTFEGRKHLKNQTYKEDPRPLQENCNCYSCSKFSRSYIRHLVMEEEMLGARLLTIHNVNFLLDLVRNIRTAIEEKKFLEYKKDFLKKFLTQNES